ncbi:hypothetical protein RHGRI_000791 [Rhododendron griersonianum]|uniref:tRNA(Ile)-lysidine synthetase n=1 Tax=Rhododendron griersonianum TaxID=479676 RepID=A0AAV6LI97_9ERIC|nr:hypothetical protein RHGRI_000791 [Rhododendron griersonianum]
MARGLLVSTQSNTTSRLILASISRISSPPRFTKIRFSLSVPSTNRSLCSRSNRQNEAVDMAGYREAFAKRMALAGLKPHHHIALGVSGGPDSIALCVLAANWKTNSTNAARHQDSGFIDGLLAIVVDHGLRAESKEEANIVSRRVLDMGIRCEITCCEWLDGRPKKGHLQEAARDRRYQIFQNVCIQHQIGVLLIAHHADDQAELFILRLSRNSGVLGLAGMAFASQLYPTYPDSTDEASNSHGILLVRPLLEFLKDDMYKICQGDNQEWVEDPTNQSALFARNRIRIALKKLSSYMLNSDIQAVISACRTTRLYVDQFCDNLINQSVTIMAQGYAVIDLEILSPSKIKDICLSKFVALVLQFISQRHRPVRGSALKSLLDYFRTFPCKTSFTAAGCYLCPAPGSKGTKVLVCCSVDFSLPSKVELFHKLSDQANKQFFLPEGAQIIADGKSHVDHLVADASEVHFLDVTSSESVLLEAKRHNILSESTYRTVLSLQRNETNNFRSKTIELSDTELKNEVESVGSSVSEALKPGQIGYFMNRFLVKWEWTQKIALDAHSIAEATSDLNLGGERKGCYWSSCLMCHNKVAEVCLMVDAHWMYLAELSQGCHLENSEMQMEQLNGKITMCADYAQISAQRALVLLKTIPVAARRGLPVLVNSQGQLLCILSIGFKHCPCLTGSAVFKPRVPLGGGHSSFI